MAYNVTTNTYGRYIYTRSTIVAQIKAQLAVTHKTNCQHVCFFIIV